DIVTNQPRRSGNKKARDVSPGEEKEMTESRKGRQNQINRSKIAPLRPPAPPALETRRKRPASGSQNPQERGNKEMAEVKEKGAPTAAETASATTTTTTATQNARQKKKATGLTFRRLFSKAGVSPYDEIEWELRTAAITDAKGNIIFEQKDVETPK